MADNHDEHEGPLHQAPWVPVVTVAVCFGVAAIILIAKMLAHA